MWLCRNGKPRPSLSLRGGNCKATVPLQSTTNQEAARAAAVWSDHRGPGASFSSIDLCPSVNVGAADDHSFELRAQFKILRTNRTMPEEMNLWVYQSIERFTKPMSSYIVYFWTTFRQRGSWIWSCTSVTDTNSLFGGRVESIEDFWPNSGGIRHYVGVG